MTDIVERLREIADEWFNPLDGIHESINQGADEIERLRADNDYIQKIIAEYQSAYGFFAPRSALKEKE